MKSTSNLYQFLQSWGRNRVSFQTKPDNRVLPFGAWSEPREPPIGCLPFFFLRDGRLCATTLGEKKANVKRNDDNKCTKQNGAAHDRFDVAQHANIFAQTSLPSWLFAHSFFGILNLVRAVGLCVLRHTPRCDILFVSPLSRCWSPANSRSGLCVLGPKEVSDHVHVNYTAALKDQARSYRQRSNSFCG